LGAVALMPLLHLWTIDQLDRTYRALHRLSPATLALSFDDRVTPNGSAKRSTQAGTITSVASNAPLRTVETTNERPAKPAAHVAAAAEMLTTPSSYWHSLEMMVSSAGTLLLGGVALAMICSIARDGRRDTIAAAGGALGEPVRLLAGMAEQTRRDARETVHAMRTPISTIIGFAALLKRSVPPDNAKAWRAIEAIEVSTARLNSMVDEAWARALAVANLMQSHRERVVLRELAASIIGTSSARFVTCDAAIETSVYGPRAAIEEVVRAVIEAFAAEGPDGKPAMISFAAGDGTIGLQVERAEADLNTTTADDLGLDRWPRLHEAARTARLLGGSMEVLAREQRLLRAIVELPSAPRSG
jgi:signal transduction histidine kinase